jgi:hypothetical protein
VRLERTGLLDGLAAVCRDTANFPARLSFDHRARAFSHNVVIVGDKDS